MGEPLPTCQGPWGTRLGWTQPAGTTVYSCSWSSIAQTQPRATVLRKNIQRNWNYSITNIIQLRLSPGILAFTMKNPEYCCLLINASGVGRDWIGKGYTVWNRG